MKVIKINNRDYVIKFTSKVIRELNAKGITFNTLAEDMQILKLDNLYDAFYHAIKDMNKLSFEEALDLIDAYYDESEENDIEKFFTMIIEEYSKAMGLGKKFKEVVDQEKAKME